jgi:hypothetical protein
LGYGLAFTYGEWKISVSLVLQGFTYKKMTGSLAHSLKDPQVMDTTGVDLRGHHIFPEASKLHNNSERFAKQRA